MKFETLGNPSQPAVLLIHGSLCSAVSSRRFGSKLAEDYYVIMPTLDGHDGDSVYTSAREQAVKILQYLMEQGVERLAMLHGTSMGAVVALEMLHQNDVLEALRSEETRGLTIDRCVLDGGVFFSLPEMTLWAGRLAMRSVVFTLGRHERAHAVDVLLYSLRCRGMFGKKPEPYRPWVEDMYAVCTGMSKDSIPGIANSCYRVQLPQLTAEMQRRCWFHFSTREPAYMMKKTLLARYPEADYRDVTDPGHCYQQVNDPEGYAAYLCGILNGTEAPDPKPAAPEAAANDAAGNGQN